MRGRELITPSYSILTSTPPNTVKHLSAERYEISGLLYVINAYRRGLNNTNPQKGPKHEMVLANKNPLPDVIKSLADSNDYEGSFEPAAVFEFRHMPQLTLTKLKDIFYKLAETIDQVPW